MPPRKRRSNDVKLILLPVNSRRYPALAPPWTALLYPADFYVGIVMQRCSVLKDGRLEVAMSEYDDIGDEAYSDNGLSALTVEHRRLFEATVTAVGMPPTMRGNARLNLLRAFDDGGVEAVQAILEKAIQNRDRIAAWLKGQADEESRRP